jgi:hypothetical protein
MLVKATIFDTSKCRGCSSAGREFTETWKTTSRREGLSLLEESQRLINDDSTIGTKNFKLWEIALGLSFIMTPFATMLATDAIVADVRIVS